MSAFSNITAVVALERAAPAAKEVLEDTPQITAANPFVHTETHHDMEVTIIKYKG